MDGQAVTITVHDRLDQIGQAAWDGCACPEAEDGGRPRDPFTTYRFLKALEDSGSVGPGTGWHPQYMAAEIDGQVIACAPLVEAKTEQLLVVDIGGGSTELVWIDVSQVAPEERVSAIMRLSDGFTRPDGSARAARVVDWISVPLGVATLKDQFSDVDDDAARFALMSWFFEEKLADFSPYTAGSPREGFQIVGTSGTVTTVAACHLGLKRYDRTKVDGLTMSSTQIDAVIRTYLTLGPEGRRNDPRIGRDRHTLIMSGAAILQALMRVWPTDKMSVADRGLREGLLYAQMAADGVFTEDGLIQ